MDFTVFGTLGTITSLVNKGLRESGKRNNEVVSISTIAFIKSDIQAVIPQFRESGARLGRDA
jgi:hypothetical protein